MPTLVCNNNIQEREGPMQTITDVFSQTSDYFRKAELLVLCYRICLTKKKHAVAQ